MRNWSEQEEKEQEEKEQEEKDRQEYKFYMGVF